MVPRGVVQLFNAVQKHQKNVDEKVKEAGSSIRKRAKLLSTVSKKDFISVLRGMDGSTSGKSATGRSSQARQVRLLSEVQGLGLLAFSLASGGGNAHRIAVLFRFSYSYMPTASSVWVLSFRMIHSG